MSNVQLLQGDCLQTLRTLPDGCVQTCVTSPPYFGLRDYGHEGQIGLEETPEAYVAKLVEVFREVRRVLHPTGVLWLNLGDSYAGSGRGLMGDGTPSDRGDAKQGTNRGTTVGKFGKLDWGAKPKDLIGIPWMVAFALRADGWWLRSDIIWCLSGGTWVYARTQKGDMPMTVKDLSRLDPATVQLWNGKKWTQLLGMSKSDRKGDELELVLRSGERIACTPTHKFPTQRGLLTAGELVTGDVLQRVKLPEPERTKDGAHISLGAAWLAGLYIAEGSRAGDTIQIAGHANQTKRLANVQEIVQSYGGSVTYTIDGNKMDIRIYGKVLNAIIDEFVTGKTAIDKGFAPVVWRYSDAFISNMMMGYLDGDGHYDEANNRWRLGFVRNYNLERDLRAACARLGWHLVLNMSQSSFDGRLFPSFRGEIRMERSGHHNERNTGEIIEIRKARSRNVYDLGVADEPHVFALASGILTHNSKPNPMPESVTDRPTKAHEYIFLLSKSAKYYYDADAIAEKASMDSGFAKQRAKGIPTWGPRDGIDVNGGNQGNNTLWQDTGKRNRRSVWTVTTKPYKGAHFATFPPDLIEPCILAGTSAHGCCSACGAPWARVVERSGYAGAGRADQTVYTGSAYKHPQSAPRGPKRDFGESVSTTIGWQPTCACAASVVPCTVLDPFNGSGTTGAVAVKHGRNYVGCELNPDYIALAWERIGKAQPALFEVA